MFEENHGSLFLFENEQKMTELLNFKVPLERVDLKKKLCFEECMYSACLFVACRLSAAA